MQKIIYTIFSTILYIASWVLIGYIVLILPKLVTRYYVIDNITIIKISAMILLCIAFATGTLLSVIQTKEIRKFITRFSFVSLALIYVIFLFYSLFLTAHAVTFSINLLPFKSIVPAVYNILSGGDTLSGIKYIIYYLFVFIPLGIFLFFSSSKFRSFNSYFITMIIIILFSLVVQCLIKANSFNIDNIILSVFGILFAYIVIDKIYTKGEKKDESNF